jgi:hypothetical protein
VIFLFIILLAVVAFVLIMWLNYLPFPPPSISDDLTQQSQVKITQTFAETQKNFAIWPERYDLQRGYALKMSAGIKNDASDGQAHNFVINVIPLVVSQQICPNGDINNCSWPGKNDATIKEFMETWTVWDKNNLQIQTTKVGFKSIIVKPSPYAAIGAYVFSVVACKDIQYSNCTLENYNWGHPQQLTITVTS